MTDLSDVRIFLCTTPTKMNYSFDRLMGRAQEVFDQDPTSGHLFLFLNRNRDRIKILFWDRDGFCIWYKRLTYARNQWAALRRYTEDGRLTIDNNISERTLRHQAIGRKNWLFLGSEAAGPRAAVLYTILAGAKSHRIEPWAYVRDILRRLHADGQCLEDLLPDRWAAEHPEAILNHRLEESRAKEIRTRARRAHRRGRAK